MKWLFFIACVCLLSVEIILSARQSSAVLMNRASRSALDALQWRHIFRGLYSNSSSPYLQQTEWNHTDTNHRICSTQSIRWVLTVTNEMLQHNLLIGWCLVFRVLKKPSGVLKEYYRHFSTPRLRAESVHVVTTTRAATNDYFVNRLVGEILFRLID